MSHFQLCTGNRLCFFQDSSPLVGGGKGGNENSLSQFQLCSGLLGQARECGQHRHQPVLRVRHAERGQDDDCGVRVKAIKACDWHLAREH